MHIGSPEPGSDREKEFNDGVEQLRSKILSVVERRQSGEEQEDIPFIDALLQSGVSHDQVLLLLLQVFAIELVTFAVDFVPLAVEFGAFAVEFVALTLQFVALAIELDALQRRVCFRISRVCFRISHVCTRIRHGYNDSKKLTTCHKVNDFCHGGCHLRQKKLTEASFTCHLAS